MNYAWLIFALLSAATAALVAIFGKIGLKGVDTNTATAIRAVVMAVFLVAVILIQGKLKEVSSIFSNQSALTFIILSGIAGALSWLFYFFALSYGDASRVVSIDRLSIVFVLILATLFLGEKFTLKTTLGVSLMTLGAIIIALK
ncbi:MAG: EamA family transporter [archaeon]